ncbi:hypothetical protein [uncultured Spirosoma sp.]|uniref:hypothetical protein n=1 Tax=uncultured Spirosoma sp. TaxID=278208 RepID=UPI00258A9D95|nr:hypothetical protein [uncultured Spirosoma sp.]
MKELVKKFGTLVKRIVSEKGELSFFGLVLREDASVWDVLVAADWIDDDRRKALEYVAQLLQTNLTTKELLSISGIVLLQNEYFEGFSKIVSETGWEENDIDLYGVSVRKAYIFVASDAEWHVEAVKNQG